MRAAILWLLISVALTSASGCSRLTEASRSRSGPGDGQHYLNHDLSTGDLSQWPHRDYGLGTEIGSNSSGGGYIWYHGNVAGSRAVGLTATPTAHASPAAESDSVFLWDPTEDWNYAPYEFWLRTSVMFPSAATISAAGAQGEQAYRPTTGEWNWFLVFHNDSNPVPSCAQEVGNVSLDVKTDGRVERGVVGTENVRLALRITGGNDCSPNIVWVDGPRLVLDHWYKLLLHIKWDPSSGVIEWYLDNFSKPYYSNLNIPTLYTRPSGYVSPSYTSLTEANYRWDAPWSSTIYFGPLVVGATRDAVQKAF